MSAPIPGEWKCERCGFVLSKRFLSISTGRVGVDATLERETCPNDGALMVQRTEADVIAMQDESIEALLDEVRALRATSERGLTAYGTAELEDELQRRGGPVSVR